ncbi:hypothetical protein EJB05_53238, partial [Eragrostis curvula]
MTGSPSALQGLFRGRRASAMSPCDLGAEGDGDLERRDLEDDDGDPAYLLFPLGTSTPRCLIRRAKLPSDESDPATEAFSHSSSMAGPRSAPCATTEAQDGAPESTSVKCPRSPVETASDDEHNYGSESIVTKRSTKQRRHLGGMPDSSEHALVSNKDNSASVKRPRSSVDWASDGEHNYDSESVVTKRSMNMLDGSEHALVSNMDNVSRTTNGVLVKKKVTTKKVHLKERCKEQLNPHSSLDATTMQLSTMGIRGSLSDQGLTATLNSSCQANGNEDEVATQLPFIKNSSLWSLFEEIEVFKKMPQQPHFSPLQKETPIEREGTALHLMLEFAYESIRFSVEKLQTCLNKLIEMKSEYAKHITKRDVLQAQKQLKGDSCSEIDNQREEKIKMLMQLGQELQQLDEAKKAREAEFSELEEEENMVDKACQDIKEQFGDTLAEHLG